MFSYTKLMQAMVAAGVVTPTDPYFNLVTLLLPGNGTNGAQNNTFLDSSSNNFTITRNGNTTQGTFSPFSQTGWGNYFSGGANALTVASNAAFDFAGNATVELWVYFTGNMGARQDLIHHASNGFEILKLSGDTIYCGFGGGTITSSTTVVANQWYHIALVRSSTGTNGLNLYINGSNVGSATAASSVTSGTMGIGAQATGNSPITGYISNLRITKNGALYTSTFTPSTTPLTTTVSSGTVSLLTCQSNRFVDNSSNSFALTVVGSPSVQAFSPFAPTAAYSAATNGGSGYFDGAGDYLQLPVNSIPFGANDFTVEGWVYRLSTSAACFMIGQTDQASNANSSFNIYLNTGVSSVYVGSTSYDVTSPSPVANSWAHIAFVRTGANLSTYLNGSRVATIATLGASSVNSGTALSYPPTIFSFGSGINQVNGYLGGLRIIVGSGGYDATSSTITVPTSPFTATANTKVLLNCTNAGITDATAKNIFETVGNASISTAQSKFGGGSMFFDGTGDYLSATPKIQSNAMQGGNATIEMWVYSSNSSSSLKCLIDTRSGQGTDTGYGIYQIANNVVIYGNGVKGNAAGQLAGNTWTHLAVTRANTTNYVFIGGTLYNTFTYGNTLTSSNVTIASDVAGSNAFTGYIDDLRITNGYARYTANFTPTTVTFPLQ